MSQFGSLLDTGRKHMNEAVKRPLISTLKRHLIIRAFSKPSRVRLILALARLTKPFLPKKLATKMPVRATGVPKAVEANPDLPKMLTIQGCVQSVVAPQINHAATKVLERSGICLEEAKGDCCGALAYHLDDLENAQKTIRKNIDSWYQDLKNEHKFLVVTSSGCSSFIKQYGEVMQNSSKYARPARFISERCRDLSELDIGLDTRQVGENCTVAFHSPCTLQHGQRVHGKIEAQLQKLGYRLVPTMDPHLCCGSAGSYSLLETELSAKLLENKLACLEQDQPDVISTANIGCLMHLQSGTETPVKHWIELLV